MGQLFDKPMDELREAFVRTRFAEPAMFGRADILEWLADPEWTGIIDFDRSPAFVRYFEEVWKNLVLYDELKRFASPTDEVPDWMLERVHDRQSYLALTDGLKAGGAKIYYPWVNEVSHYPVVVVGGVTFRVEHQKLAGLVATIRSSNVRDVLEILNAEIKGCRPNAEKTRTFMNRMARHAVAGIRKAAVRDFDEAVAVSADGTRIVKAKWVIVVRVERNGEAWLFPASAFRDQKIRRRPDAEFARRDVPKFSGSVDAFFSDTRHELMRASYGGRSWQSQILTMVDANVLPDIESVLLANIYDCPSPLPDGGRKIG